VYRWKRLLEDGRYRSAREIAEAEGLARTLVNRLLRLILPTLHMVEAILDGMPRKGCGARGVDRAKSK
jgi:hypothetical protein